MPELRRDPVVGRWVIIASERAKRPSDFTSPAVNGTIDPKKDPFAEGNESMTPPEIFSFRSPHSPRSLQCHFDRTCKADACVERFVLYSRRELCYFSIIVAGDGQGVTRRRHNSKGARL